MNQIKLFIELTRLKKPIGYMLLFWPCAWGLTLAYDFSSSWNDYYFYLILFFLGSVLMRSAGCIVNDILDRKFDAKVFRTKDRPIASGKISVKLAIVYSIILCLLAFLVLINFNVFTIILALGSMPLAFTYPLMKRFTYWPQLFLGITFNYGLILGWTAINAEINIIPILFYFGAIFWTLGYDTIYGFQDIKDDEIIGLKSTSIKFKGSAKKFLFLCYSILIVLFFIGGIFMEFHYVYYFLLLIPIIHLFFYQMKIFNLKDPMSCLKAFKSNNLFGLIILINILIVQNF
ncbi:4-hydroxybenzoate octaprenyltransferase [Candidatus Pelagibacter sp. HIMB1493]|uniref:4-hydroxybenzoate octaprenyltransferase n=1 Tax=Candidatus Pelagibacter sp. HIMB1493 TaxID=3413334 RepID=UPI003F831120